MRTAIYVRVSTKDKQDISKQRDFLMDYAEKREDLDIKQVYHDVGVSGTKSSRPAFDDMLNNLDKYDAVLVYKIDRIGRSLQNLLQLIKTFEEKNVKFISATQPIDTSKPEGRFFLNMLAVFAEFEREMTIQRINDGLERAKKRGVKLGRPKGSKDRNKRDKFGYYQRWVRHKQKYGEIKLPYLRKVKKDNLSDEEIIEELKKRGISNIK